MAINSERLRNFGSTFDISKTLPIKKKPYYLLLYAAGLLMLISFLKLGKNPTIDLHLHDTYFVIGQPYIFWLLAIVAFFVWVLYLLTDKILYSKKLTWSHVIITILTLVFFVLILFSGESFLNPLPKRYYEFIKWNSPDLDSSQLKVFVISIFVLLWGQIIFVANLIAGVFVKKSFEELP